MDGSSMLKNQSFESSKVIAVTCISSIYANNFVVMGSLVGEKDGIIRSVSDTPPTHYQVIIQSFSLLSENAEKYESAEFEAGGYKWKLVLHLNGNKSKNVEDHISIYLAMADATSLPPGWEVSAVFRLFLLYQNQDNYLIVQDSQRKQSQFRRLTPEWGFDQFIPITVFTDSSNGYLVDDTYLASLTPPPKIYANYSLVLSNELWTSASYKENHWFSASSRGSGSANFIPLRFCLEPAYKYLVKDCLFFRAAVTIRGIGSTL
ncbi:hypothetical protein Pint_24220 [Pistacia integerrima]|uniref:Uncharacterized protein n=1 Tax=Pistacia integerrima TaxID=434235 RepID=A0ACC0YE33_9ROSI|nr:hypothetical protein Pint_24220 [Pistacia integerrima]